MIWGWRRAAGRSRLASGAGGQGGLAANSRDPRTAVSTAACSNAGRFGMGLTCGRRLSALMLSSGLVAFAASEARAAFECPVTRRRPGVRPGGQGQQSRHARELDDLDAQHRDAHVRGADDPRRGQQPDPRARRRGRRQRRRHGLHLHAARRHQVPQRQGDDLGRRRGLVRALQDGRHRERDPEQRRELGNPGPDDFRHQHDARPSRPSSRTCPRSACRS